MKLNAYHLVAIAAAALLVIVLVFIVSLVVCCQSVGYHKQDTTKAPNHTFGHAGARNVMINGNFDFYFKHDIRILESTTGDVEFKAWAPYMIPRVEYSGDSENLTMNITISCAIDNDFGTPYASEYIYLPPGANYSISIKDENGDIQVGRFHGDSLNIVNRKGTVRIEGGNYSRIFIVNDGNILVNESLADGRWMPIKM